MGKTKSLLSFRVFCIYVFGVREKKKTTRKKFKRKISTRRNKDIKIGPNHKKKK